MSDDSADQEPPGEAEKVQRVRILCETGKWSARNLSEDTIDDEMRAYESGVYNKRKEAALILARTLTDEFYREAALHSIIDLCVVGGETEYAKGLFESIQIDIIRENILKAHPQLATGGDIVG